MFEGIPVDKLTAPILLLLAVLMVFVGWLVPRYVYKQALAESKTWREAYEVEREARVASESQTTQLLELGKASHSVLVALFNATGSSRPSGGTDVVPTAR